MSEKLDQRSNLPSGLIEAKSMPNGIVVGEDQLPWLKEKTILNVARCEPEGGRAFYLASAIGTNDDLVAAASGMTDHQRHLTDNMFYARIQPLITDGHSNNVSALKESVLRERVMVMRNNGGQRVYFAVFSPPEEYSEELPLVIKLAVCDKNKQSSVFKVLSTLSPAANSRKRS